MDPTSTEIAVTGGLAFATGAARRLLGPLADAIGRDLAARYEYRAANAERIVELVLEKLGEERLAQRGSVHPRLMQAVLDDGSWCDDALMQEYLAGILAAGRTAENPDDRGVMWAKLVMRLSAFQIRTHYVLYECARRVLVGSGLVPGDGTRLKSEFLWSPGDEVPTALEVEGRHGKEVFSHAMLGIEREGLIGSFATGTVEDLGDALPQWSVGLPKTGSGLVYSLSASGVELYMWALGLGGDLDRFTHPSLGADVPADIDISLPTSIRLLRDISGMRDGSETSS